MRRGGSALLQWKYVHGRDMHGWQVYGRFAGVRLDGGFLRGIARPNGLSERIRGARREVHGAVLRQQVALLLPVYGPFGCVGDEVLQRAIFRGGLGHTVCGVERHEVRGWYEMQRAVLLPR